MIDDGANPLDDFWEALVTAALLGTDRRDPPVPPEGPIGDLVADAMQSDGASRMLTSVSAVAAVRRAAFLPLPSTEPLRPPTVDGRPWAPPSAVATWRTIVRDWPVLEDEWLLALVEGGFCLPPDALTALLRRHRTDAVRRARVALAAGPVARWVVEHVPSLGATAPRPAPMELVTTLPDLPVPPELRDLVTADAHTISTRLRQGFEGGHFGAPHRAVLVNLIARCRPAVLTEVAEVLERLGLGLASALADQARLRNRMLTELDPGR